MAATKTLNFAATVDAWAKQSKDRMEAVFRESSQRVIEVAQTPIGEGGRMPIIKGFLRSSLRVVNGAVFQMAAIKPTKISIAWDIGSVAATIATAKSGDTITAIYLANYALRVNYGFVGKDSAGREFNQSGHAFVELAVQQWPKIVRTVNAEAKGRAA